MFLRALADLLINDLTISRRKSHSCQLLVGNVFLCVLSLLFVHIDTMRLSKADISLSDSSHFLHRGAAMCWSYSWASCLAIFWIDSSLRFHQCIQCMSLNILNILNINQLGQSSKFAFMVTGVTAMGWLRLVVGFWGTNLICSLCWGTLGTPRGSLQCSRLWALSQSSKHKDMLPHHAICYHIDVCFYQVDS